MTNGKETQKLSPHQRKLHEIIFEADTKAGKLFDIILLVSIALSVTVVVLDSVSSINAKYSEILFYSEWFFTILFSIEYVLRLYCVGRPLMYARSFYGIIDLVSILPTYLSLILPGGQIFITIRLLRMLRVFRILKFVQYIGAANNLTTALKASRKRIAVFVFTILIIVIIVGSLMYAIEGEENGFTSIPHSIYWAIVTLTTVGYGDISPQTGLGQFLASIIMILGYGIIAVPTGIVTSEMTKRRLQDVNTQSCPNCSAEGHDSDAKYCKHCGARLN
jgi:voltage-gated potassium channel